MRLFAAAALVVALSCPTFAAPAPAACEFTLEAVEQSLTEQSIKFMVLDEAQKADFLIELAKSYELKTGQKAADMAGVTAVILAVLGDGELYFGIEVDGCLTAPALLSEYLDLPQEKRSGLTPAGIFA